MYFLFSCSHHQILYQVTVFSGISTVYEILSSHFPGTQAWALA